MSSVRDIRRPETDDELVVDLDVPVDVDADAIEAIEEETRRIVFNILFVAFTIAVVIVVLSVR